MALSASSPSGAPNLIFKDWTVVPPMWAEWVLENLIAGIKVVALF